MKKQMTDFFKANLADIIDYSFNGYCDAVIPLVR